MGVVIGDGNGSQIGEQGEEDDQVDTDSLVDSNHGGDEVKLKMQAEGDTVLDISLHALEDLAGDLDGRHNGRQTGGKEDNIGGSLGSFGSTLDGNTAVRLLQRGSIVDTITSHSTGADTKS